MEVKFNLAIDARPQPRPRFSGKRAYQPAAIVEYKAAIKAAAIAAMNGAAPFSSSIRATLKIFRKFAPTSRRFGDFDNHAKAILDAMNGVVFLDDSLVVQATIEKHKSDTPHVEVEVQTMT